MNNLCSSSNKVSTHYITWLFSFWIWSIRWYSNLHGVGPLGPSPWAPMGATHAIWTTLNPLPLRMIPAKFGDSATMRFQEEDANVKSLRTTDDARRTTHWRMTWRIALSGSTDDGRKRTAIAHSSLRLRWAKNQWNFGGFSKNHAVEVGFSTPPPPSV